MYERFEGFADNHLTKLMASVQGGFDLFVYARGALRAFKHRKGLVWGVVKLRVSEDMQSAQGELCAYTKGGIPRAMKQKHRADPDVIRDVALDKGEVSPPVMLFEIDSKSIKVTS